MVWCSVAIENNGKEVQVRNFLGEKIVRTVQMFDGVTATRSNVRASLHPSIQHHNTTTRPDKPTLTNSLGCCCVDDKQDQKDEIVIQGNSIDAVSQSGMNQFTITQHTAPTEHQLTSSLFVGLLCSCEHPHLRQSEIERYP